MNKRKLSVLLLLVALFTGFSANAKVLGLGIGPKVGMTFNKFSMSKDLFDSNNRCGFTGGVTAEYIAPAIGIGADLSVMFSHMESEIEAFGGSDKVCGNFIEIPLHLKYKLTIPAVSNIVKPYIYTGPNLALKISSKESFGDTKDAQWGWDLGLGVELIKHLQVGAGYTFGINNVAKHLNYVDENFNITEVKVKNNYWTVSLAWLF